MIFKQDFPIFQLKEDLVYLDSAATTQKPSFVLDAIDTYNRGFHANIHRGAYDLSIEATRQYDLVREKVRAFIGAHQKEEIVFTRGTTESINLLASGLSLSFKAGDVIVLSILEHHSNLVPWQQLAKRLDLELRYMYCDEEGLIHEEEISKKITSEVKLVAMTMMSNAIGVRTPFEMVIEQAHKVGAKVLLDAAQMVAHEPVDVKSLDVDFLVFSGHKMMASTGIGVLYGKKALLENLPPYHYGGDMIEYVEEQETSFAKLPERLEAGTPNIEGAISLGASIDYINKIGFEAIHNQGQELIAYALEKLDEVDDVNIIGTKNFLFKGPVISFNVKDVHSHDTAFILNNAHIAVRSGHHCTQPLMKFLKLPSTTRASFYIYNTKEDIDQLVNALKEVRRWLGYGS